MTRILLPLDGSKYSDSAIAFTLEVLARNNELHVTGLAVLDAPGIDAQEAGAALGASSFARAARAALTREEEIRVEAILAHFEHTFAEANVGHFERSRVDDPADAIITEAAYHDVVVLGQRNFFNFDQEEDPDALVAVLKNTSRPVVAVPAELPEYGTVVVAWDGSAEAARALQLFCLLRLPASRMVLVTVVDDDEGGEAILARVRRYVESHGYSDVELAVASGDADEQVLALAQSHKAGLIVMGAFGHSGLRALFFGSTTKHLLANGSIPVFLAR